MWPVNRYWSKLFALLLTAAPAAVYANDSTIQLNFLPPKFDYASVCKAQMSEPPQMSVGDDQLTPGQAYKRAILLINGTKDIPADPHRASLLLERVSKIGDEDNGPKAQHLLARLLDEGLGVTQNQERAISLLKQALPYIPKRAGTMLGNLYRNDGRYEEAAVYYKTAAADGSASAYFSLSNLYKNEFLVPPTKDAADKMLASGQNILLADLAQGNCRSLYGLANIMLWDAHSPEQYEAGMAWLNAAAAAGHRTALRRLGNYYYEGKLVKLNVAKALDLWRRAAQLGSSEAMFRLGEYYIQPGAHVDYGEAQKWLAQATTYHHPLAGEMLVDFYRGISGAPANYDKSFEWLSKLSQRVNADAYVFRHLAEHYEQGLGTQKDILKAFDLYKIAAEKGSAPSMVKLGDFYKYGLGVERSPIKSYRYYRLAANNGDMKAMTKLITNYHCGVGKTTDKTWSDAWRQKAVYFGVSSILLKHLDALMQSDQKDDHILAVSLARRAIKDEKNHGAMTRISFAYKHGIGVEKSEAEAEKWLNKAIKEGTDEQRILGLREMSKMLLQKGQEYYAPDMAFVYLERARKLGSAEAAYEIGNLHTNENHAMVNDDKARASYLEAAEQGHLKSIFKLGRLLMKHVATSDEGLKWLHKAAEQNHAEALIYLASYYATKGGEEAEQAHALLERAKQNYPCRESLHQQIAATELNLSSPEVKLAALIEDTKNKTPGAIRKLANHYFTNEQKQQAIELLAAAAKEGNAEAMVELGNAYAIGIGVGQSMETAKKWWEHSAKRGNQTAIELLKANRPKKQAKDKYSNISH